MVKYEPLREYLSGRPGDEEPMTFGQMEQLVGPLPDSARKHRAWWANDNKSQALAWRAAGWHVASVNQASGQVVFARGVKGGASSGTQRARLLMGASCILPLSLPLATIFQTPGSRSRACTGG
jgi:hypothetical protein